MKKTRAMLAIPFFLLLGSRAEAAELTRATSAACSELTKTWGDIISGVTPFVQASSAFCEADCGNGATISCSGTSCSAQDRNCSLGIQGSVSCDGRTSFCLPACECTPGAEKQEPDGCCTPYKGKFRWYVCNSSGVWEWTPYYTCYGGCTPPPIE